MYNFFIYLFRIEWQPSFFATILLLYTPPKVTSVLVLFVIFGGLFIYCYIGRPSWASLATSVAYRVAFISLYSLCCNMLTANDSEVVDWGLEHTLLLHSIFF